MLCLGDLCVRQAWLKLPTGLGITGTAEPSGDYLTSRLRFLRKPGRRNMEMGAQLLWRLRRYSRAEFLNALLELEAVAISCHAAHAQICRAVRQTNTSPRKSLV